MLKPPPSYMATKSVTFHKQLITDTWILAAVEGSSYRKLLSRSRRRQLKAQRKALKQYTKRIMSRESLHAAWAILLNPENNSEIYQLASHSNLFDFLLQEVMRITSENDISALQSQFDIGDEFPETLVDTLRAMYGIESFQNRFVHEQPDRVQDSEISTDDDSVSSGESSQYRNRAISVRELLSSQDVSEDSDNKDQAFCGTENVSLQDERLEADDSHEADEDSDNSAARCSVLHGANEESCGKRKRDDT